MHANASTCGDQVTVAAALERDDDGNWITVITVY